MAGANSAEQLAKEAQKAEKDGQIVRAYLLYAEAAAADPQNPLYWDRAQALRPAASLINASPPRLPGEIVPPTDPTLFGKISEEDLTQARRPLPPAELKAAPGQRDFDFSGDSKSLWEQLAAALGLNVVFYTQYQPTRPLRFQLSDAGYHDALRALQAATDSFIVPVTDQLIFVARDAPQKRTDFERTAAVVIPFTETITLQELQEIVTSVRGLLDISKLVVDTQKHLILMRDRIAKVRQAQKVLNDLLRPRAQVAIEVEILAFDRSSALNYGLSLPTAFPLVNFPVKPNLRNVIPQGFSTFLTFGGGASLLGLGVTSAELFATASKSNSDTVLEAELVALDGQPASMHIGEKYPIMTNGYFGSQGSPSTNGSSTGTGTPNTPTNSNTAIGAGTLQLSQSSLQWTYASGGATPATASLTATDTSGTIDYTATVVSSSPWLLVNNQSTATGTLPGTLTVSPGSGLTSLVTGSYQGTIQVNGSDGSVAYVNVNLTVNGGAQDLILTPGTITLTTTTGGLEVQQTVTVTSSTAGALSAVVVGSGLSVVLSETSVGANTASSITVLGNPAGLSAENYAGVLSVTIGGMTAEIPVSFNVLPSGTLQLSQSSIQWPFTTGGNLPSATNVTVLSSRGGVSFTATASSANSWLLVNGQTEVIGQLPTTLTVSPSSNLAQLGTGTYTGTVQISSSDGSLAYFNVNLTVNGGTATGLTVSPNPISFNVAFGGAAVQQTITVTSVTAGTLTANVNGTGLSVSVPTTTVAANTPVTFTLTANPTGLQAQNYVGYLTVTVSGVTQTVQVSLSVGAISSGTNGTSLYAPPPTFNFEDLGLVLKVTPHVHGSDEVSLDITAEFELLGAASVNGIPVIQNRKYESKVTVKTGEWAVLAGLMTASESRSISGLPLLSVIPLLRSTTVNRDEGRTLIVLKPHVLIEPPTEIPTSRVWSGSETRMPSEL